MATTNEAPKTEKMKVVKVDKELVEKLNTQLELITHKKKLSDNRTVFLARLANLEEFKKIMVEERNKGAFEQTRCRITFTSQQTSYRDEEKIGISNPDLILYFIDQLVVKINEFVSKIEAELIA